MSLKPPSVEQAALISAVVERRDGVHYDNVMSDSVAGSGKTTTVLNLAGALKLRDVQERDHTKIAVSTEAYQLTYNASLRLEVRSKALAAGITNLTVHTYHSLAVRYFDRAAHTDERLIRLRHFGSMMDESLDLVEDESGFSETTFSETTFSEPAPIRRLVLIIDEAQDMTPLYCWLVQKWLRDFYADLLAAGRVQFVIIGDRFQSIYGYKGADASYLTDPERFWGDFTNRPFVSTPLKQTFRCSSQICDYVNRDVLCLPDDAPRLVAAVTETPSTEDYLLVSDLPHKSDYEVADVLSREIAEWSESGLHRPEDIFILASSIRSAKYSPLRHLERCLVALGVPVYYAGSDDEMLHDDLIRGKVVFGTYHNSKGRERDVVVIFGYNASYFRYAGRDFPRDICPPPIYVALTRARKKLICVKTQRDTALPFLRTSRLAVGAPDTADQVPAAREQIAVTDLVRFLSEAQIHRLIPLLDRIFVHEHQVDDEPIVIQNIVPGRGPFSGLSESVASFNGTAIVMNYTGERPQLDAGHSDKSTIVGRALRNLTPDSSLLFRVVIASVLQDGLHHRLYQLGITPAHYNWITPADYARCNERMTDRIGPAVDTLAEVQMPQFSFRFADGTSSRVVGQIDVVTATDIWELKCTNDLQISHRLQLLLYAYGITLQTEENSDPRLPRGPFRAHLLNVLTGEQWGFDPFLPDVRAAMQEVIAVLGLQL